MKAALGKTISGLSSITRGTYNVLTLARLRNSQPPSRDEADEGSCQEMNSINGRQTYSHASRDSSMAHSYTPPPDLSISVEDDILYRKNNVYLKCRMETPRSTQASSTSALPCSSSAPPSFPPARSVSTTAVKHQASVDQQFDEVPGFLFIASRGSNYGSTLILNWAPNSTMIHSNSGSINSRMRTAGQVSDSEVSSSGESNASNDMDRVMVQPVTTPPVVERKCVSIDLGTMEIVRVFYHPNESGCIISGEMVVTSKQRNFWVFQFQNGGLTDLIHLFRSWKYFSHQSHQESKQHTFTIFRPKLSLSELHPLEGRFKSVLTEETWSSLSTPEGRVTDSQYVRQVVFFQGVSPSLRQEVWPFLLGLHEFDSSAREREAMRLERCKQYWMLDDIRRKREREEEEEEGEGLGERLDASVIQQIDKDVVRTDRSHPYYRGEGNRHVGTLKHILLNYLVHKPDISYCQGMTDLLAPLLAALDNEVDAFWCFERLVEGTAFFKPAKDHISVDKQLEPLRKLIKQLLPWFYSYLEATENGLTLMFCHRWLLVCLKREFSEPDTLAIWEACWTNLETNSFHLFICIAIMAIYGQRAVEKQMNINELMVFFNTLSLTMPRDLVLTQARGYLHQFSNSATVHCSLSSLMAPSFWQRPTSPRLVCGVCKGLGTRCENTDFQPGNMEATC